ncbi:recombinase family protein [Chroococcidiopsis sp. CCMEE 29]|uniref:recombinase family protein n=1 Tax=Chroococcidiopsis sp. CCMEE 29 TaxID=155894 RepID=UPI0020226620|nr:recombinase family protein [Chroococcidiopsis sp. CCMEE 29]
MKIIAYSYSDPLLEPTPDSSIWGWELDQIYQDLGKRLELRQLINDCRVDPVDYLLIRRLEELGDSVQEVSDRLAELEALGVQLIATEQPYTSSQQGQEPSITNLRADLLKLLQEIQHQQRSRRIRQGHARNRVNALPPPGKAPYGYRRGKDKYILDRTAAPIVKDFFEQFLLYGSLRGAVRYLGQKYGKKISVTTGRRWLTNPVYRGDTAYQNGQVVSNTHIPIISKEEAAQVDRLLRRNSRLPPRSASAPRSLAGLVICQECQSSMLVARVTTPRKDKEYLYLRPILCPKRPKCRAISYEQVLEQTIAGICQDLPRAVAGMNLPQLDAVKNALTKAIAIKQDILAQLPTLTVEGVLDTETAALRAYNLRTEISELQAKLATLPPVNLRSVAQAVSIPQFWLDLSESERRFYFREFICQIEIIRDRASWQIKLIFIF